VREIKYIVVHCSATKEGKDFGVEDFRKWHKRKGWSDVGYHFVIRLDGTIEDGRPIEKIGAGVRGYNSNSIHICYTGGVDENIKPKDTRTEAQKEALRFKLMALKQQFPHAEILGHRDFDGVRKACPSFDAKGEYKNIWL